MDTTAFAIAVVAVFLGALVQGSVGFGFGLIAAPIVSISEPRMVPVVLLLIGITVPLLALRREPKHIDWSGAGWALLGRLLGAAAGAYLALTLTAQSLGVGVGIAVLLAVALSVTRVELPVRSNTLVIAGFISGVGATATSIGGPPLAILYQRAAPATLRSTMSLILALGSGMSIGALGLSGQIDEWHIRTGLTLLAPLVAGFALSSALHDVIDRGWVRPSVLTLSAMAALGAIANGVLHR